MSCNKRAKAVKHAEASQFSLLNTFAPELQKKVRKLGPHC